MPHFLESLKGYGGYSTSIVVIIVALATWWKVLPSVIDALANRQSKIEERMGKLLDDATQRFEKQIAAADARHEHCMEGQEELQREVKRLRDHSIAQDKTIEGLRRQILQMQVSAVRIEGTGVTPLATAAVEALNKLPGVGE